MKIKPSSATSKKPVFSDKPQSAKKPTVVKCFICNQMFYSQQTFDSHMDQHQKKVNKNLPDEIQRKTMESFGLKRNQSINKKNSTLEAINQNELKDKNQLNKTLKLPISSIQPIQNPFITKLSQTKSSVMKKTVKKIEESNKSKQIVRNVSQSPSKKQISPEDEQISQIDGLLKESSLLMSKITSITQKYQNRKQLEINKQDLSVHESSEEDEQVEKSIMQGEFVGSVKKNNWSLARIEQEVLKVKFNHFKTLQNFQIQIQYLRKIGNLSTDPASSERISKTKSKILAEVVKFIMNQNTSKQDSQFLNELNKPQREAEPYRQEQNLEARTCAECLDLIAFGQMCIVREDVFFHKGCFLSEGE